MKKLVLFGLLIFSTFTQAKMVNGIALIVEGEPVTTAEIRAIQTQMNVSKEQAIDLLIQDRLQKSAMRDITIDETSVDSKIAAIAAQNNVTIPKMQKILQEQGTPWTKYRESIREAMKKEKFYKEYVINNVPDPREEELKLFYKNHKETFAAPSSISVIEYSAPTEASMKHFLETKNKQGIKSRSLNKKTKDLDPSMMGIFLGTQDGSYTRPLNAGDRFISYKIISKNGSMTMPFELARGAVAAKWKQEQQGKALKDYFEKLKTNADIQIIR